MKLFQSAKTLAILSVATSLGLVSCSDPQKDARNELKSKGYEATVDSLLLAAAAGDTGAVDHFQTIGLDIDTADALGNTALIKASASGKGEMVEKILGLGADPRQINRVGRDALMSASEMGFETVARTLMSRGSDNTITDVEGWSALSLAAYNGHANVVSLLASQSTPEDLDDALLVASFSGDATVIDTLLGNGANINARSPENKTPLMISAEGGKLEVVKVLLQNQANPYAVDGGNQTAALLAEAAGYRDVQSLILNPDEWGSSPQGEQVLEEMKQAQMALADGSVIEETLIPLAAQKNNTLPATGSTAGAVQGAEAPTTNLENRPSDGMPAKKNNIKGIREEARSKPIVSLNGSTLRSTDVKSAPMKTMVLAAYHEAPLPIVVNNVEGSFAEVKRLDTPEQSTMTVETGAVIPGTEYRVNDVTSKYISSKEGKGRMVDVSRVEVQNTSSGARHLLVKDVAGQSADTYAILTAPNSQYRYVVKTGDVFRTDQGDFGKTDFQVLDIRANGVVVKDLHSGEVTTIARDGVVGQ